MSVTATLPSGADVLLQCLVRHGVEVVFAYPGGAALPILQALTRVRAHIRTILPRHEQGGGFGAIGYARSSGKVGVVVATSGPGATNLVTCLSDAQRHAVPLVAITGQVNHRVLGTDAFQEIPIVSLCRSVVKHHYLVLKSGDLTRVMAEALHIASTGRPGPVLVDVPKDLHNERFAPDFDVPLQLPGYRPQQWSDPVALTLENDSGPAAEVFSQLWQMVNRRGQLCDTFVTSGRGPASEWLAQAYRFPSRRHWITTDSLGADGFALSAALGVQAAHPGKCVIAVDTPDSFVSHVQELACAYCEKLPVKVLLLNPGQDVYPDCVTLAHGFRAAAWSVSEGDDRETALSDWLDHAGSALLEVRLSTREFAARANDNTLPLLTLRAPAQL
jgi:thiamine pyrophosphate-dependent acetolactate synthase large subunit-like protein